METGLYVIAAILALVFRYNLGLIDACKKVGVVVSSSGSDTGFQDALTPPNSTTITLITWIAIAATLGYLGYEFGWGSLGIGLGIFVVVSVIVGVTIIPQPDSKHFVAKIYSSLANRYAGFLKSGDVVRADAAKHLITLIENEYPELKS